MIDTRISEGLAELSKLSGEEPDVALAMLEKMDSKAREDKFLCYWQPHDYEMKVFDAFEEDVKILVVCGGNRSGKTEVGSAITMAWAEGKDYFRGYPANSWARKLPIPEKHARNIWMVGLDFPNHLVPVIWQEKLMTGANHPGFCPKDESVEKVSENDKTITFANRTRITGKSADSGRDKFQSASVDFIWIDEECDAEIFDECYQRTVDCGGKILVTVTPLTDISSGAKTPWIFNLYEDMKAGRKDIKFVYLSVLDNPSVPQQEKDKLIEKWSGHPEERARLYGEFVRRSGLVYPMWNRRIHLVAPKRIDRSVYKIVSIDPAATGVTAALWGAVDTKGNITLYREYYNKDLVVSEHAENIRAYCRGESIDVFYIDPKWGAQRNAETHKSGQQLYRDCGIPVRLAEVDEDYGLNESLEYMQATTIETSRHPKVFVHADLTNFIFEIEHYTYDTFARGPLKGLTKEKPRKRDDHLLNAMQYMMAMRPRPRMFRPEQSQSFEEDQRRAAGNSYFS